MSKAELENLLRNQGIEVIMAALEQHYETDVLRVGANEIAVPVLDAEQNEKFLLIKVSTPRGTRNGEGGYDAYDGYAAAEDYKIIVQEQQQKKAAIAAKKAAEEKKRAEKAAAKKAKAAPEEKDDSNQFLPHEVAI